MWVDVTQSQCPVARARKIYGLARVRSISDSPRPSPRHSPSFAYICRCFSACKNRSLTHWAQFPFTFLCTVPCACVHLSWTSQGVKNEVQGEGMGRNCFNQITLIPEAGETGAGTVLSAAYWWATGAVRPPQAPPEVTSALFTNRRKAPRPLSSGWMDKLSSCLSCVSFHPLEYKSFPHPSPRGPGGDPQERQLALGQPAAEDMWPSGQASQLPVSTHSTPCCVTLVLAAWRRAFSVLGSLAHWWGTSSF